MHKVTAISDLNACVCDRALLLEIQDQLALGDARPARWVIVCLCYRSRPAGARAFSGVVILAADSQQAVISGASAVCWSRNGGVRACNSIREPRREIRVEVDDHAIRSNYVDADQQCFPRR
jgi:hypothetical protein